MMVVEAAQDIKFNDGKGGHEASTNLQGAVDPVLTYSNSDNEQTSRVEHRVVQISQLVEQ
jgi:hypothetical protein